MRALIAAIAAAQGFRGVLVFGTDDAKASAIVYRFAHASEVDAFRQSAVAQQALGRVGDSGEAGDVARNSRCVGAHTGRGRNRDPHVRRR